MANQDRQIRSVELGPFASTSEMGSLKQANQTVKNATNVLTFPNTHAVLQRPGLEDMGAGAHTGSWVKFYDFKKSDGNVYRIWFDISGDWFHNTSQTTSEGEILTFAGTGPTTGYPVTVTPKDHRPVGVVLNDLFQTSAYSSTGGLHKFDGSSWTALTALGGTGGTGFYRAKNGIVEHDRIFIANIYELASLKASRIRFSAGADGVTWAENDYIDVNPDDGEQIQALVAYQGSILVFKDTSVYVLSGKSADSFSLTRMTAEYGTRFGDTVAVVDDKVVFLDNRHGLVMFDGEKFMTVSVGEAGESINSRLYYNTGTTYEDELSHAFGFSWASYYAISYPTATAATIPVNNETLVLDTRTGLTYTWTFGVEYAKPSESTPIIMMLGVTTSDSTGDVQTKPYKISFPIPYHGPFTEIGAAEDISCAFETGWISLEDYSQLRIKKVEFDWWIDNQANDAKNETLTIFYDRYATTSTHVFDVDSATTDDWLHVTVDDGFTSTGVMRPKRFKVKFSRGTSESKRFGVKNIVVHFASDERAKEGY